MSDERFDCIIVGGGLAGLTAAYILAGEGMEVLLVEKGNYSGAKNMTGGRLYTHSFERVGPGFLEGAPLERKIVKERFSRGCGGGMATLEYESAAIEAPGGESYSVLRGLFDRWLADQAEEQGAMLVYGVKIDELLVQDGKVYGVRAGEEEMEANVVILADGVNSLLGRELGITAAPRADNTYVGVKEVLGLSEDIINERFGLAPGEGAAWLLHGCIDVCEGFLYTNKDSVSIGLTMLVGETDKIESNLPQLLEDFKESPEIAPLLEGSRLMEYSAHLLPEGSGGMQKLYADGVLVAGDSAALCVNLGYTLRGMDLAVESGRLAAQAVIEACGKGDFTAQALSAYQAALEGSFISCCVKGAGECHAAVKGSKFEDGPASAINGALGQAGIS